MANPFTLQVIPPDSAFCDRDNEIKELSTHARNGVNVVLFSPRRYGKTSLLKRIQSKIQKEGILTVYIDIFMVTSVNDVAERIAKGIYRVLHRRESLLKKGARYLKIFKTFRPVFKPAPDGTFGLTVEQVAAQSSGFDLLDEVMGELGEFIRKEKARMHIAIDEFQEITEIKKQPVEGLLRKHVQEHEASYFFVGSRRRILLDMFNQRKRPFYQSAVMYPIEGLPHRELSAYLFDQFKKGEKNCPITVAERISETVSQYPYYAQLLAYHLFEISGKRVREDDLERAFEKAVASERYGYEAVVQGLTGPQVALLRALATDPTAKTLSTEYMGRHKLSVGGIQYARSKLESLDLIEKREGIWRVVDPVFSTWLMRYYN